MKIKMMTMVLAAGAVSIFGGALSAQSYDLSANIPFTFQVGDMSFTPGKYEVRNSANSVPTLRSAETGHAIFVTGAFASLGTGRETKLVFRCYGGDKCFLGEIWPSSSSGSLVPKSKAEKELINGEGHRAMAAVAVALHRAR